MKTIFVRYLPMGAEATPIPPCVRSHLLAAINTYLATGDISPLIRFCHDKRGYGICPESTWYQLVKEVIDRLHAVAHVTPDSVEKKLLVLRQVLESEPSWRGWQQARELLTENIDVISGWQNSFRQQWQAREPVILDEGRFYIEMNGVIHECFGRKTLAEERWDCIAHSCERPYGDVHELLRVIALVYISEYFGSDPDAFPNSIQIVLPEQQGLTSFRSWQWRVRTPRAWESTKWRPVHAVCDPEWLAADLIARFAIEPPHIAATTPVVDDLETRWRDTFSSYSGQIEFIVEGGVLFGRAAETWFTYQGTKCRWINQTDHAEATLIVPIRDRSSYYREYELGLRLLSRLAFQSGQPMRSRMVAVSKCQFSPSFYQTRRMGGIRFLSHSSHISDASNCDLNFALALFREGLNSGSIHYAFLSFFKVVQLAFKKDLPGIDTWIADNLGKVRGEDVHHWLSEAGIRPDQVGKYLNESGRCAIAHVNREPTIDPDNPQHHERIGRDLPIAKGLALLAIEGGLFGQSLAPYL